MEATDEGIRVDVIAKAMWVASIALLAKKKTEKATKEVLELAWKEMKRKGNMLEAQRVEGRKKIMRS